jgi:hypothetical protein
MQNRWPLQKMSITPTLFVSIYRGRNTTAKKSKEFWGNSYHQNNQPIDMRVQMATRESPEEMSRMFTENVCIDFDQLILALVKLLRML